MLAREHPSCPSDMKTVCQGLIVNGFMNRRSVTLREILKCKVSIPLTDIRIYKEKLFFLKQNSLSTKLLSDTMHYCICTIVRNIKSL